MPPATPRMRLDSPRHRFITHCPGDECYEGPHGMSAIWGPLTMGAAVRRTVTLQR